MKNDFSEVILYDNLSFDQLIKEIHDNSKSKSKDIKKLIDKLSNLVQSTEDASLLVPLIVEYLEVDVKNDDQLVKLANVIQRFVKGGDVKSKDESTSSIGLTDAEKEELLAMANDNKIVKLG